jgi:hypothetical protein
VKEKITQHFDLHGSTHSSLHQLNLKLDISIASNEVPFCMFNRPLKYKLPYFPAHKKHRPIRCTMIFPLEILEKMMMNIF